MMLEKYELLSRAVNSGAYAHAYLFTSVNKDKLYELAIEFCYRIISKGNMDANETYVLKKRLKDGLYTDLLTIAAQGATVKIEQIRKINEFFSYNSFEGLYRFAVINDADKMNETAQNALLKTLEDPADNRILILLAVSTDNLLPTILSRVQSINLDIENYEQEISNKERLYIREKTEEILFAGNVAEIFILSDFISKDRMFAQKCMEYMFELLCIRNAKISDALSYKMGYHIRQALINLKGNSSVFLTVQAMLIKLQEEYNAENSRDQI